MFSHIAEETSRLSHAFLGALFSVILIFGNEDFWAVMWLCFFLYTTFVLNSASMHFAFKGFYENRRGPLVWAALLFALSLLIFALMFAGYFLKIIHAFSDDAHAVVMLGLCVFGAFVILNTLANGSVIQQRLSVEGSKDGKQNDPI